VYCAFRNTYVAGNSCVGGAPIVLENVYDLTVKVIH